MNHIVVTVLVFALTYFLVVSAGVVGVFLFTLRSLRDVGQHELPPTESLTVRFLVLLHVCGLLRAVNLVSMVLIAGAAAIHIGMARHRAAHYPLVLLILILVTGALLTNSLLKDIYFEARTGIPAE